MRVFSFSLHEHCITMTRPENKISEVSSFAFVYDRYKVCIGIPMSIETRTDMHAACTCALSHQATHAPTHCPPPPRAPYTLPPSLNPLPERRELVKDARRQHADCVAEQVEAPGHETRRQSALTHSTSTCPLCPLACTCMCPMHMRHAHARVHRGSLSLCICAHHARVYVYACAYAYVCV